MGVLAALYRVQMLNTGCDILKLILSQVGVAFNLSYLNSILCHQQERLDWRLGQCMATGTLLTQEVRVSWIICYLIIYFGYFVMSWLVDQQSRLFRNWLSGIRLVIPSK